MGMIGNDSFPSEIYRILQPRSKKKQAAWRKDHSGNVGQGCVPGVVWGEIGWGVIE
jgi:hypothetical protein